MRIVCRGCRAYVDVMSEGVDRFGNPYQVARSIQSKKWFIHYYDPFFDFEEVWDVRSSRERAVEWIKTYLL